MEGLLFYTSLSCCQAGEAGSFSHGLRAVVKRGSEGVPIEACLRHVARAVAQQSLPIPSSSSLTTVHGHCLSFYITERLLLSDGIGRRVNG